MLKLKHMDQLENQPPQPNIQEQEPQPEVPQKQSMSVWIVVLIILISVAAIAMSGYAAYYYFTSDEPIACKMDAKVCPDGSSVGRISPDCEFAECPEVIDPTADWQMYRNEEYGFELKHPTNWRKIENDGFIGFGPQTIASDSIFTIYKDKSIPEVGAGSNSNQEITKVEDIQFKGLAAKNISIKNISLNKVSNRIFMNYNDFILSIGQSTINNTDYPFDHKYNNIIDEILSTFKFIEIKDKQETMTPPERLCFDNGGSFVVRDGENFCIFSDGKECGEFGFNKCVESKGIWHPISAPPSGMN